VVGVEVETNGKTLRQAFPVDDISATIDTLDQADEEILTTIVSGEALEAAAGTTGAPTYYLLLDSNCC
jgi:hypothetical protein